MGARPLFVLKDACRPLYPIGFVISTQCASHRESIQNREDGRPRTPGSLRGDWLRILPSNEHGHHDGNKRSHHGRENRLPPVQPRQHRESHLQPATIEKRIGGRQFFAFAKADLYSRGTSASAGCCGAACWLDSAAEASDADCGAWGWYCVFSISDSFP